MTREEKVLQAVETLGELKSKREKIKNEIEEKKVRRRVLKQKEDEMQEEVFSAKERIFIGEGVEHSVLEHEDDYTGRVSSRTYDSLFGHVIHSSSEAFDRTTKEEWLKYIDEDANKKIGEMQREINELKRNKTQNEQELASLYAEKSTLSPFAILKRRKLEKRIKTIEKRISDIDAKIADKEKEIADFKKITSSQEYIDDALAKIANVRNKIIEYEQKREKLKNFRNTNGEERERVNEEIRKLESDLVEIEEKEKEILVSLGKNVDNVKALEKIVKDPKIDDETRENARKIISVIAKQGRVQSEGRK